MGSSARALFAFNSLNIALPAQSDSEDWKLSPDTETLPFKHGPSIALIDFFSFQKTVREKQNWAKSIGWGNKMPPFSGGAQLSSRGKAPREPGAC